MKFLSSSTSVVLTGIISIKRRIKPRGAANSINRFHTGCAQGAGDCFAWADFTRKQRSIRRETNAFDAWDFGYSPDELHHVTPCQRFAARNSHLGDAQLSCNANKAQRFFKGQDFLAWQPLL